MYRWRIPAIDAIRRLVAPPEVPVRSLNRVDADGRQLLLPSDYLALMREYGPGAFDEYLSIFSAGNQHPSYDILTQTHETRKASDVIAEESRGEIRWPPYPWWPEAGSLLQWGDMEEHDFYWLTRGIPDDWPVVVLRSREGLHEQLPMTATELVLSILNGPAAGTLLPDLAGRELSFVPSPE